MKQFRKIALGATAASALVFAVVTAFAHSGSMDGGPPGGMSERTQGNMHGGMQGMGSGMHGPNGRMGRSIQHDETFSSDMGQVHELLAEHDRIERKVTSLSNGIRTVTESDDAQVAKTIQAHVASMTARLSEGRGFNMFGKTLPILFENKDKIETKVEMTQKGAIVTQTSVDSRVVAALQGHAEEVSELARDGMIAMRRSAMAGMGMAPRAGMQPGGMRASRPSAEGRHAR
ncbi:MAG: hypothetical protein ABJA77_02825 [Variovorax sp.]